MSFVVHDSPEDRTEFALTRTMKNVEDACAWAQKHPIESACAIAVVAVAFITYPLPTILVLAIGALAIFGINAASESSLFEQARSFFSFQ